LEETKQIKALFVIDAVEGASISSFGVVEGLIK